MRMKVVVELVGLALIVTGLALLSVPVGLIGAGAVLVALMERD